MLINVASGVVDVPQPFTSAYVASKHAIHALSECLRMELLLEGNSGVDVCTVYPASIDTPLFQRGANYAGRPVRPMPPVYEPEEVAAAILDLAEKPRREASVGVPRRSLGLVKMALPDVFEEKAAHRVNQKHFRPGTAEASDGNLFGPVTDGPELRGGWGGRARSSPGLGTWLLLAAAAGAGIAVWQHRDGLPGSSQQR